MKRILILTAIAVVVFAGCSDENTPIIHPCNLPEDKNIAFVKMGISSIKWSEGIYGTVNELGYVKYENGILEFDFPMTVPYEYLGEYFWYNSENIIPEGVTISDPQAKIGMFWINAYNKADEHIGVFSFVYDTHNWWYAAHIYADRSFTVTGTSKHGCVFDCYFEKGWNIRYYTPLNRGKYTTQKPSNEDLKWRYEELTCF